jgi:iron(III) transport system ATP-binding protein
LCKFFRENDKLSNNSYIRPEHIHICPEGEYEAIIKSIVFYGSFYEIIIETQKEEELLVHSFDDHLEINQKIRYSYDGEILIF